MQLRESAAHLELRRELRAYFAGLMPEDERRRAGEEGVGGDRFREVVKQLGSDGWLGIGWPTEYGGQGRLLPRTSTSSSTRSNGPDCPSRSSPSTPSAPP